MSAITRRFEQETVTILSGQTKSGAFFVGDFATVLALLPATLDGTAMTFEVSDSKAGTFLPLKKADGLNESLTVAASTGVMLPLSGAGWAKIVMGTAQATTQTDIVLVKKG